MTESAVAETCAKPLRADAKRNRDKLVAEARNLFVGTGSDVSLELIAKSAGVGIGTLYRHFPSRIDLVVAVYQDDIDQLEEASRDTHLPAWDGLLAWTDQFVEFGSTKRALLSEIQQNFDKESPVFNGCRLQLRSSLTAVLDRTKESGEVREDVLPEDLLRLLGGAATAPGAERDQVRRLVAIVLAGIRAH